MWDFFPMENLFQHLQRLYGCSCTIFDAITSSAFVYLSITVLLYSFSISSLVCWDPPLQIAIPWVRDERWSCFFSHSGPSIRNLLPLYFRNAATVDFSSLLGKPVSSTSKNQISSFPFDLRTCVCICVCVAVVVTHTPLFMLFSVRHLEHLRIGTVETTTVVVIIKIFGSFSLGKPAATEPTD